MTEGKSVKIFDKQATPPGFYVRDISSICDEPAFDILFVDDDGTCRYSNDILAQSKKPSITQRNAMPKQPTMNAGITANIDAGF